MRNRRLRGGGERIFVMQSAENSVRDYDLAFGQPVSMFLQLRGNAGSRLRHGLKRRMRPSSVVVRGPIAYDGAQVSLAEGNDPVQAFAAKRSNEALAKGVRFRAVRRRFQYGQGERARGFVE